jgi:hypothetical protein
VSRTVTALTSIALATGTSMAGIAASSQTSTSPVPTHAVRGIVKSISTFYLVAVAGAGKKAHQMTFLLNPATERDGDLSIGATVSIRYRVEHGRFITTAVSREPDKQPSGAVQRR